MEDGCNKRAISQGEHGGGRRCSHPECGMHSANDDKCFKHGGGTMCSYRGYTKFAQYNDKCNPHAERDLVLTQDAQNVVRKGGMSYERGDVRTLGATSFECQRDSALTMEGANDAR